MKNNAVFPLLKRYNKIIGLIVLAISILLITTNSANLKGISINSSVLTTMITIGLFLIAFSKEKNETIELLGLRYNSFKLTFGYLSCVLISVEITSLISGLIIENINLHLLGIGILLFYNVVYYILKLTNKHLSRSNNGELSFYTPKWLFAVYIVFGIILIYLTIKFVIGK